MVTDHSCGLSAQGSKGSSHSRPPADDSDVLFTQSTGRSASTACSQVISGMVIAAKDQGFFYVSVNAPRPHLKLYVCLPLAVL